MGIFKVFQVILVVTSVKCWLLDLTSLSEDEKVAIDQLREELGGISSFTSNLKDEYMEEDWYLSKWLSAKEFNVSLAKQLLLENVKWREEHRIDRILEEDWREMEAEFEVEKDCVDLEGRPILYLNFGKWDVHKLMTEEDSLVRLGRYLTKLVEEMDSIVRRMRATSGLPNQFNLIVNFDGYDIWNQGCFQCLAFYKGFASTVESHYPRSIERVVMVNVPARFEVIYWYIEADLMEKTRRSMHLFGEDRGQWEPAILGYVGRDQVPGKLLQQKPRDVVPSEMLGYFRPSDEITTRLKTVTSGQI